MSIAWFILITGVIVVAQSYIFNRWGLSRIEYKRSFSHKSVFEGEKVEMIDEIANKKLMPIPWLRLESKIDANLLFEKNSDLSNEIHSQEYHRTLFSFMPFQKIRRRQKATCLKRGYYSFKTVSMSTGDPFGMGETFKSFKAEADLTVYPSIISVDEIPLPSHSWLGDILVRRWIIEDPFVTAGVREYSYGDPMNAVNWKATARTGSLQVSKKDYTADHHLMIYLNFDESEDSWMPVQDEALMEKGISYAASIAQYSISNGVNTGFGCNGHTVESSLRVKPSVRVEPSNGKHQLTHLLDTMARLKMEKSMSFNHFLLEDIDAHIENTDILLITKIITPKIQEHIRTLQSKGNAVEILWLDNEDQTKVGEQHAI